jgi:hypothetical protein
LLSCFRALWRCLISPRLGGDVNPIVGSSDARTCKRSHIARSVILPSALFATACCVRGRWRAVCGAAARELWSAATTYVCQRRARRILPPARRPAGTRQAPPQGSRAARGQARAAAACSQRAGARRRRAASAPSDGCPTSVILPWLGRGRSESFGHPRPLDGSPVADRAQAVGSALRADERGRPGLNDMIMSLEFQQEPMSTVPQDVRASCTRSIYSLTGGFGSNQLTVTRRGGGPTGTATGHHPRLRA